MEATRRICPQCKQQVGNPDCELCQRVMAREAAAKTTASNTTSASPDLLDKASRNTAQAARGNERDREIEKKSPQMFSLVKKVDICLEKKQLSGVQARVAFVLDASGSMAQQYLKGNVQAVIERMLAVALRFDDDGELDTWAFASRFRRLDAINLDNVEGYVKRLQTKQGFLAKLSLSLVQGLGVGNNEPPVMEDVVQYYAGTEDPAFIIFISDGGIFLEQQIQKVLTEASSQPIFWQFVGLGGKNYGVLERFDTMPGRRVDNANFFHIDDFQSISDDELYDRLLGEFPLWLKEAGRLGIVR